MSRVSAKNRRASIPLFAGLLLVIAPYRAYGQSEPPQGGSNIGCIEHLELPVYPQLLRSARIQGVQTVKVTLFEQAAVKTVESSVQGTTAGIERFFKEGAEKALQRSRFSGTCSGKTVTLVFHYELRLDESKSLFAFGPPNHFWIRAGPDSLNPDTSAK